MLRKDFKSLLLNLNDLTHLQKQKLRDELKENTHNDAINLIESRFEDVQSCPHCSSNVFCRWGKSDNLQRYRCKSCKKTFNALTGTPLARLRHKNQWIQKKIPGQP